MYYSEYLLSTSYTLNSSLSSLLMAPKINLGYSAKETDPARFNILNSKGALEKTNTKFYFLFTLGNAVPTAFQRHHFWQLKKET